MKKTKSNIQKILKEGSETYEKISNLLMEAVKTSTSLDRLQEIRFEILKLLQDKQILSNETIKNLLIE